MVIKMEGIILIRLLLNLVFIVLRMTLMSKVNILLSGLQRTMVLVKQIYQVLLMKMVGIYQLMQNFMKSINSGKPALLMKLLPL